MPYIKQERRAKLDPLIDNVTKKTSGIGDLVYVFCKLARDRLGVGPTFIQHCMVMGAFVCAMLEFYRRATAHYENKKVVENGDMFFD